MYLWGPLLLLFAFTGMEFVAWATHKYIMHGFLWNFHRDHHQEHSGLFERNDFFFLIFAIPSALCIYLGMKNVFYIPVWIGFGIALYGAAYFFLHEMFIHRRFSYLRELNHPYFKAIRKAHKVHHKNQNKENGRNFGMLLVPGHHYKEAKKAHQKNKSKT